MIFIIFVMVVKSMNKEMGRFVVEEEVGVGGGVVEVVVLYEVREFIFLL